MMQQQQNNKSSSISSNKNIKKLLSIQNLDLRNSTLSLPGADVPLSLLKELCNALIQVDTLRRIELQQNNLGDSGAELLSELFSEKPALMYINLRNNNIGDLGCSLIARALTRHATCRVLLLGGNPISDYGLSEVGKFVTSSNEIQELDLMDTPVSLHGTLAFADVIVKNESLEKLSLPHRLGHRVLKEVERLMKRNWMRKNRIDERRVAYDIHAEEEQQYRHKLDDQWDSKQPKYKKPPPSSGFTMEDWSDPSLVSILMSLEVLDRKTKMAKTKTPQQQQQQALQSSATSGNIFSSSIGLCSSRPAKLTMNPDVQTLAKQKMLRSSANKNNNNNFNFNNPNTSTSGRERWIIPVNSNPNNNSQIPSLPPIMTSTRR